MNYADTIQNPSQLSPRWERRFTLIEKAGGRHLPRRDRLTLAEGLTVSISLWAWFWGPWYYLYMGMWRKFLSYSIGLGLLFLVVTSALAATGVMSEVIASILSLLAYLMFGVLAYVDYYRKVVLDDNGWW